MKKYMSTYKGTSILRVGHTNKFFARDPNLSFKQRVELLKKERLLGIKRDKQNRLIK